MVGLCITLWIHVERLLVFHSIEVMTKYAQERKAFGKAIGEYGQIQKMIAESYAEYMAARHYVYNLTNHLDLSSFGNGLDSDGVKLVAGAQSICSWQVDSAPNLIIVCARQVPCPNALLTGRCRYWVATAIPDYTPPKDSGERLS
jgi:alkylation response protein AidB-like acyl-CoA dehydrogenase